MIMKKKFAAFLPTILRQIGCDYIEGFLLTFSVFLRSIPDCNQKNFVLLLSFDADGADQVAVLLAEACTRRLEHHQHSRGRNILLATI